MSARKNPRCTYAAWIKDLWTDMSSVSAGIRAAPASHVRRTTLFPPPLRSFSAFTSACDQFDMVTLLTTCEKDWCDDLHELHTKEPTRWPCTLITTAVKPKRDVAEQSGHCMFSGRFRNFARAFSAADCDMLGDARGRSSRFRRRRVGPHEGSSAADYDLSQGFGRSFAHSSTQPYARYTVPVGAPIVGICHE